MTSGSMLKYIQTNNSELNSIVEDEDEPREISEQQTEQTIEKKRQIYSYFKKISENQSKCNFCNKNLKTPNSTTTTMTRHLKTQHPAKFQDYQNELNTNEINNKKRKNKDTPQQQDIMTSMSKSEKFSTSNKKAKLITNKIVEMIALDYQPISIVEDYGFKRVIAAAEDRFVLPSREHTDNAIYNKIKNMIAEWNIEIENSDSNISIFFVTDNARNISSALSHNGSNFEHISCTAHTLQLVIDDAVKESNMTDLLKRCKAIVTHYNHSNIASERLAETQKRLNLAPHKLIQMVNTRWNSIYLMLQRMLEQKDAILIDLPKIKKRQLLFARNWNMIEGYVILLKPVFEATKELSREDTPILSMVLPIIYTIEAKLNLFLTSTTQNPGTCFAENLLRSMCKRFDVYKENKIYIIAMLVDPRFKGIMLNEYELLQAKLHITSEAEKYRYNNEILSQPSTSDELLTKKLENSNYSLWDILHQRSVSKESTIVTSINEVTIEIENYLKLKNIEPTADPLKWWEENYQTFPQLLPVIFKFLGIPGTSVCRERLFSGSGLTVSSRRTRLSPFLVEYLVFLHNQEMDQVALFNLTETMIIELLPKIGQRSRFLKHLEDLKIQNIGINI
ncbi:hypothetical protein QTP88_004172 [Uroleucon formosanum]